MKRYFHTAIFATLSALWATGSGAAEDADWLAQIQAQENLLAELESTRSPDDPVLVEPIQTMIDLLWEHSEFERAGELQERLLASKARTGFLR